MFITHFETIFFHPSFLGCFCVVAFVRVRILIVTIFFYKVYNFLSDPWFVGILFLLVYNLFRGNQSCGFNLMLRKSRLLVSCSIVFDIAVFVALLCLIFLVV